jgi:hypothetical protein
MRASPGGSGLRSRVFPLRRASCPRVARARRSTRRMINVSFGHTAE